MNMKQRWMILRGSVVALTVVAVLGALVRIKWVVIAAVVLLIPWVVLEIRLWRCPHCGGFLGRMEKKKNCPNCGEPLDWGEGKTS